METLFTLPPSTVLEVRVAHHPTAEFVADAVQSIATCTDGTPNHLLRGTFTLRGLSRPLNGK